MTSREEYEDNFKAELDEIKQQLGRLAFKNRENDLFIDLEEKENNARLKLRELRSSSEDEWESLKANLEKLYDDLSRAVSSFH